MNRMAVVWLAAALAVSAVPAVASSDDEQSLEQRLAEAQRRLEDAARDVAELSAEAGHSVFPELMFSGLPARRAMLGVNLGGALADGGGVQVNGVSPGGPAAEAGVREGDVIVSIRSKPVTTGREIVRVMKDIAPGEKVELGLRRGGKRLDVTVEARALDRVFAGSAALPAIAAVRALPPIPGHAFDWDGHWLLEDWGDAEFVTLTPGLGRYFGADKGVLVARAPEDATLGLKDGDVIVAIDGREPQNNRHAMRILRSYQPGESVEIRILRDRRAQTLEATIPERERRDMFRHRPAPPAPPTPPAPPSPST